MFETIKDMYVELWAFICEIVKFFGYEYNADEKKFVEIAE